MVYARIQLQDLDVSLRETAAAALDERGWTPEEWHRSHRGKRALRRGVKLITKQLKEGGGAGGAGMVAPIGLEALPAVRGRPTPLDMDPDSPAPAGEMIPPHIAVRRSVHHLRDALRDLGKPGHFGEAGGTDGEVQHQILRGLAGLGVAPAARSHKHVELILAMVRASGFPIKSHAQMQKLCVFSPLFPQFPFTFLHFTPSASVLPDSFAHCWRKMTDQMPHRGALAAAAERRRLPRGRHWLGYLHRPPGLSVGPDRREGSGSDADGAIFW